MKMYTQYDCLYLYLQFWQVFDEIDYLEYVIQFLKYDWISPVLRSEKRAPANVRQLNSISDVIFYCSVGERSRALALLNAAQVKNTGMTSERKHFMWKIANIVAFSSTKPSAANKDPLKICILYIIFKFLIKDT